MRATLHLSRRATYPDYLAVEARSEHRHELVDGVIVAMAGGSDEHNALASRVTVCLATRLPPACRHFSSDQRFWIASTGRARYSDGAVICGRPAHPPHDPQATTNPCIVVEVASPSSEGDDHGDKRVDFQSLGSLEAYLVVSQDARQIEVWRRAADGSWPAAPEVRLGDDAFELPGLTRAIAVAEVYEGVLDEAGRSLLR